MNFYLLKIILFALFLSSYARAMTDNELKNEMRNDIKKYFVLLKSPKLIFHWVDASDITPVSQYNNKFPTNYSNFKSYVEKQGKKIFNKRSDRDSDIAGPGLYMASDASVSRSYGGQRTFGLIVGLVNKGARLIIGDYSSKISNKILSEIEEKRGCSVTDYRSLLDSTDASCTKVKQLLVGEDVSFAEGRIYNWGTSNPPGCSNRDTIKDLIISNAHDLWGNLDTFVAYHPRMFDEIIGITHKTDAGNTPLAKELMKYLKGQNLLGKDQMADQSIPTMSTSELEKFSKKYILGCRP